MCPSLWAEGLDVPGEITMEPNINPQPARLADFRATATRLEHLARQLPARARLHAEETVRLLRSEADSLERAFPPPSQNHHAGRS